ncbi:histidine kinase N-terminal 7TM domain-containing protein [Halalkalicoccus tibetensis]|uniref:Histidine kinase N-terminal 7TM domain-containing protein n=1 Tax=Halalkalicoccus tibetensis TaxID=175632 RepID=A0ABD5UYW9_9EURY
MVQLTPTFVLIVGAVLAAGSVAALAWRQRPEPGAVSLAALMLAAAWWSATHLGTLLSGTLAGTLFWARLQWFGSVALPVLWIVFALEYTGRDQYVRAPIVAGLSVLPALTIALLWTNGSHGLVRETATLVEHNGYLVLESVWGPWFFLAVGYAYLLAAVGSLLFAQLAVGSSFLYRSQAAALLVGAALPWLSHLVYLSGLTPWAGLDLMAASFSGSGAVLLFALSRGKLLEANPSASRLASEFVVGGIDDGVVVVDSRGFVVDLNPAARGMLDAGTTDVVGRPASDVVPGYDPGDPPAGSDSEVTIEDEETTRYVDVRVSILKDYHDRVVGRAVVLRDVTERRRHRQRLSVLHRILRHNLRNEMTVVRGHAVGIADDHRDHASAIEESATRVMDLSDKAAQIERMAEGSDEDPPAISLDSTIANTVESLRSEYPRTTFVVGELPAVACGSPAGTAIHNLVENAAEHNTDDEPTVTVEAAVEGEAVRISVTDNGPGIPPVEREVLEAGGETPLRHGSGIGLWLVSWTVELLGGTIEFAENDPTGSVVTLRLPVLGRDGADPGTRE